MAVGGRNSFKQNDRALFCPALAWLGTVKDARVRTWGRSGRWRMAGSRKATSPFLGQPSGDRAMAEGSTGIWLYSSWDAHRFPVQGILGRLRGAALDRRFPPFHQTQHRGGSLVQENWKLIAEQFHSGKDLHQIDFGATRLTLYEKLQRLESAIREYPTPDSVWGGSNEVVIAVQEKTPVSPSNVHPLVIAESESTLVPILTSRTRLKLTVADREWKIRLLDDLLASETALQRAYAAFREGSSGWEAVNRLDRDYRQLIDEVNTFILTIHQDLENYFSDRTKTWQESERGQAYQRWMGEWEVEISLDELPEPGQFDDIELNAVALLQNLPDGPSM